MPKIRRIRQKMHKYEVGKGRPTETAANNSIHNQNADYWIEKIDKASSTYGADISFRIKAVSDVLEELAKEIRVGNIEPEVLKAVLRRRDVSASMDLLLKRRNGFG